MHWQNIFAALVQGKDIDIAHLSLLGHPKEATVLEIGCGDGRDAKALLSKGKMVCWVRYIKRTYKFGKRACTRMHHLK
jgi:spermidine synthase